MEEIKQEFAGSPTVPDRIRLGSHVQLFFFSPAVVIKFFVEHTVIGKRRRNNEFFFVLVEGRQVECTRKGQREE